MVNQGKVLVVSFIVTFVIFIFTRYFKKKTNTLESETNENSETSKNDDKYLENNTEVYIKLCDDQNECGYFNYVNDQARLNMNNHKFKISKHPDSENKDNFIHYHEPISLSYQHDNTTKWLEILGNNGYGLGFGNNLNLNNNRGKFFLTPSTTNEKKGDKVNLNSSVYISGVTIEEDNEDCGLNGCRAILLKGSTYNSSTDINNVMTTQFLVNSSLQAVPFHLAHVDDS